MFTSELRAFLSKLKGLEKTKAVKLTDLLSSEKPQITFSAKKLGDKHT
jgi:hypothetical protein